MEYKIELTRVDLYSVVFDAEIWNKKRIEHFSKYFRTSTDLEELATHLSNMIFQFGSEGHFEGFGYVKFYDKKGDVIKQYTPDYSRELNDDDYCEGVKVYLTEEDTCPAIEILEN